MLRTWVFSDMTQESTFLSTDLVPIWKSFNYVCSYTKTNISAISAKDNMEGKMLHSLMVSTPTKMEITCTNCDWISDNSYQNLLVGIQDVLVGMDQAWYKHDEYHHVSP